jgi:hypothetical protein
LRILNQKNWHNQTFLGRIFSNDYHNPLLPSNSLYSLSHRLEPSERKKMAGGNSLHNNPDAFSLKIIPA